MTSSTPTIALYSKVLAGLLFLTILTFIQPSLMHLSTGKTVAVQLLIAGMKIGLVLAFYMHLRREKPYLKWYILMAFTILMVFFLIVGIDVVHS